MTVEELGIETAPKESVKKARKSLQVFESGIFSSCIGTI